MPSKFRAERWTTCGPAIWNSVTNHFIRLFHPYAMLTIKKVLNEKNMDRNICVYRRKKNTQRRISIYWVGIGVLCVLQTFATFISHRILPFSKSHCTRTHSGINLWWLLLLLLYFLQILYLVRVCVLAYTVVSNRLIHCAIALFPSYDISTFVWRDFASVNASFRCLFLFIFLFFYLIFLSVLYRFKAGELNKKKNNKFYKCICCVVYIWLISDVHLNWCATAKSYNLYHLRWYFEFIFFFLKRLFVGHAEVKFQFFRLSVVLTMKICCLLRFNRLHSSKQ